MPDDLKPPVVPDPPKGDDNPKAGDQSPKGKDDKGSEKGKDTDFEAQLKQRDGTISALTKKLNDFEAKSKEDEEKQKSAFETLNKLKTALTGEEEEDGKTAEELFESLEKEISKLKTDATKKEAKSSFAGLVKQLHVDDKPASEQLQKYLLKNVDISDPDSEKIKAAIDKGIEDFKEIFGSTGVTVKPATNPDRGPVPAGFSGRQAGKRTANEILADKKS